MCYWDRSKVRVGFNCCAFWDRAYYDLGTTDVETDQSWTVRLMTCTILVHQVEETVLAVCPDRWLCDADYIQYSKYVPLWHIPTFITRSAYCLLAVRLLLVDVWRDADLRVVLIEGFCCYTVDRKCFLPATRRQSNCMQPTFSLSAPL